DTGCRNPGIMERRSFACSRLFLAGGRPNRGRRVERHGGCHAHPDSARRWPPRTGGRVDHWIRPAVYRGAQRAPAYDRGPTRRQLAKRSHGAVVPPFISARLAFGRGRADAHRARIVRVSAFLMSPILFATSSSSI